jgi:asparagine synthase (glutamine-hydrolysing)
MSMAHSIESRVPLLDNEVIEFASTTSGVAEDQRTGPAASHVLKEVAAGLVPREILDRRKQGFGVPLGVWFRGGLRELFADTLLSASSLQRGYFQAPFVRQLVHEHMSQKRDHTAPVVAAGRLREVASAVHRPAGLTRFSPRESVATLLTNSSIGNGV